jgi:hypothetical protein
MSADYLNTWSPAAIVAAHTSLLALIDGAETAGTVTLHDSSDVLLATVPLTTPAGWVNSITGALTLTPDGRDESADASGVAFYATLRDGDGEPLRSLTCQVGSFAIPGLCVMNTVNILAGGPVELISVSIS